MGLDELRHDATSLARFVESISAFCSHRSGTPAYSEGSRALFDHFKKLSDSTLEYLAKFPSSEEFRGDDPFEFQAQREALLTLRSAWSRVHLRLKAVADADTLHVPVTLLDWLQSRFRTLHGFEASMFAVFHTERVNFLHLGSSDIPATSTEIADIVERPDEHFPETLSLIGIPYSQSDTLFFNCIIPHEIGHFLFASSKIADELKQAAGLELNAAVHASGTRVDASDRQELLNLVEFWAEELFCDLAAIWLIGPSFSYASIEVRDLVNAIDHRGVFSMLAGKVMLEFGAQHPAHLYRIKQHVRLLDQLGWWALIKSQKSHYIHLMAAADQIKEEQFTTANIKGGSVALAAFFAITPKIFAAITRLFDGVDSGSGNYAVYGRYISESLLHGIVPSTLNIKRKRVHPLPISIITAAYDTYLNTMDKLIRGISGQKVESLLDRMYWSRRLEQWATKAVEDVQSR
jgi:hypothetical protein